MNREISAALSVFDGAFRTCHPDETYERAMRVADRAGVTRVARLTSLDSVGIPVWSAIRPNSRSLSVSQGKGCTDSAARTSALMESLELFHSETFVPNGHAMSIFGSLSAPSYVDPLLLPICLDVSISSKDELEWIEGSDLFTDTVRFVPRDICHMDLTVPGIENRPFAASSNGLASGNTRDEAIIHAICELIERDQKALWQAERQLLQRSPPRLRLDTVDDPASLQVLDAARAAHLEVAVWSIGRDISVPCFFCAMMDPSNRNLFTHGASGAGCHPLKGVALTRALTEALQSRLTFISGARDDLFWRAYRDELPADAPLSRSFAQEVRFGTEEQDYAMLEEIPEQRWQTGSVLAWLLNQLAQVGIEEAVLIDLSQHDWGFAVVKVVVPGLEIEQRRIAHIPGPRLLSWIERIARE